MRIGKIRIQNFRALKDVEATLSDFACIIGENNAGKSSFLQALISFLGGSKLELSDFYDELNAVRIAVTFEEVSDHDLELVAEQHRQRVSGLLHQGSLTLVRCFELGQRSELRCMRLLPRDEKYQRQVYEDRLSGKKGSAVHKVLEEYYPEVLANSKGNVATQKAAKELIGEYISTLRSDEMGLAESDLPSGIPTSVSKLLPDPVYIAAVKDLSDDVKTNQQATFGKLLSVLLGAIEPKLSEVTDLFRELDTQLNRSVAEDGTVFDDRLDDVKEIEEMVQNHLRDTFANVELTLRIPPPEFKMILSNADFEIDDGVLGTTDSKGDGLRRAVTFAIFRTYAELSARTESSLSEINRRFLFLFEEPELFLHPIAQNILFDALNQISKRHQVIMTTHSPFFFRPDNTGSFIKMQKAKAEPRPIGKLLQFDISELSDRDLFQLISFETSNTAFFARKVVLVEGDSELIVLPHIASKLNEGWDFAKNHIALVKVNGKGSIRRYIHFFSAFEVPTLIVADLDILGNGFNDFNVSDEISSLRSSLLQEAQKIQDAANETFALVGLKKAKKKLGRGDQRTLWKRVQSDYERYRRGDPVLEDVVESFGTFVESMRTGDSKIDIIADSSNKAILAMKRTLLSELRSQGIYIWEKGCLEDYYPANLASGKGKPQLGINFRNMDFTREDVMAMSDQIEENGKTLSEFEILFASIFD